MYYDAKKMHHHWQNTSKDTKIAVFKRIGSVILANSYAINPDAVGDRVKKRFD